MDSAHLPDASKPMAHEIDEETQTLRGQIQTMTLVLAVVRPRVEQASLNLQHYGAAEVTQTVQLDRLSLFFFQRARGAAVAVSTNVTDDTIEILYATRTEDDGDDPGQASGRTISTLPSDAGSGVDFEDPRPVADRPRSPHSEHSLDMFNRPIPQHAHAKRLEQLLQFEHRKSQELERYVLFYCLHKIRGRLHIEIAPGTRLLEIMLGIDTKQIAAAFRADVPDEAPPRLRGRDEAWLRGLAKCGALRLGAADADGRRELERSARNERVLWRYLALVLRVLRRTSEELVQYRAHHAPQDVGDIEARLDSFGMALRSLDDLVALSPSFWRLLRNRAVVQAILDVRRDVPVDSDTGAAAQAEETEDPRVLNASSPQEIATAWLHLLLPWPRTLRDIRLGALGRDRRVVIRPVREEAATDDFAPLEDVLRTLGWGPPAPLLAILRSARTARERKSVYRAFITHEPGTAEHEEVVKRLSKRSTHGASQLASRADTRLEAIGVSETCCFACQQYLKHRGVLHSGSHGNVAIWIPPQDADREALRHMHEQLRIRLSNFFFAEKERTRELKWDAEDELLMRSLDLSKEPEAAEMSDDE